MVGYSSAMIRCTLRGGRCWTRAEPHTPDTARDTQRNSRSSPLTRSRRVEAKLSTTRRVIGARSLAIRKGMDQGRNRDELVGRLPRRMTRTSSIERHGNQPSEPSSATNDRCVASALSLPSPGADPREFEARRRRSPAHMWGRLEMLKRRLSTRRNRPAQRFFLE